MRYDIYGVKMYFLMIIFKSLDNFKGMQEGQSRH